MIEIEDLGRVRLIRLARGRGNALNIDFLRAIDQALVEFADSSARAAVLTGQGSVFGAGVDLPELVHGGESYIREFMPLLTQVFGRLAMLPKPIVAAVNGHAIAGGAILMMACDQRILARGRAKIGLSEVLVGVRFPAWAIEIARFAAPPQHFPQFVLTGRSYLPDDALKLGWVDELVDPDSLMHRAIEVAEELAAILPEAFVETKRAVRRPMLDAVRATEGLDAEVTEHWCSAPVQAAIKDFVQRMIGRK